MSVLYIKDSTGKVIPIPSIRGEKGPKGDPGAEFGNADKLGGIPANGYALRSGLYEVTLFASEWQENSYTLQLTDATPDSVNEILPGEGITQEQLAALQAANLVDGGQASGSLTLVAYGDVPTMDIPIRVIIRGDL